MSESEKVSRRFAERLRKEIEGLYSDLRKRMEELQARVPPFIMPVIESVRTQLGIPTEEAEREVLAILSNSEWPLKLDELRLLLTKRGLIVGRKELEVLLYHLAKSGIVKVRKGFVAMSSFAALPGAKKILERLKERKIMTEEELSRELKVEKEKLGAVLKELSEAGILALKDGKVALIG